MIADKVNATIVSNDSYQEFHDQYSWLFDNGRLIGGKPVPKLIIWPETSVPWLITATRGSAGCPARNPCRASPASVASCTD